MPTGDRGKAITKVILIALLLLPFFGCNSRPETPRPDQRANSTEPANTTGRNLRVRMPAVAGLFYPADEPALSRMVDGLLESAPAHHIPNLKGLVCPHAGYPYSGPTAAIAYKTLMGSEVQTVIILGPSHYAAFQGASVPNADAYQTPLGTVLISDKAQQLARTSPFVLEPRCLVQRPSWWTQSSKSAPAAGEDTPDTWEHSVEVQVPFLQKTLKNFKILPVVFGDVDPEQAAKVLAGIIDDKTIVVASSDLSHYHPYEVAKSLDNRCVTAILNLDIDEMRNQEACGKLPILTLMYLAREKGWKAQLLDYRNSGDTSGDKSHGVVGYAAIAFTASADKTEQTPGGSESKPATGQPSAQFSIEERKFLLDLARKTLKSVVAGHGFPEVKSGDVPAECGESKGCFVTLTEVGQLRGCIGNLQAAGPLYQAVMENAQNAALRDHRFSPVTPDEVDKIKIEISVLTEPQPLRFTSPEDLLNKLRPNEDGVVLQIGSRGATFLPQVWEQLPDKVEFLNHLAQKAGCAPDDWRGKDVRVSIYHVEAFKESE